MVLIVLPSHLTIVTFFICSANDLLNFMILAHASICQFFVSEIRPSSYHIFIWILESFVIFGTLFLHPQFRCSGNNAGSWEAGTVWRNISDVICLLARCFDFLSFKFFQYFSVVDIFALALQFGISDLLTSTSAFLGSLIRLYTTRKT